MNVHSLICLMALLQHTLSTPVAQYPPDADLTSDFSDFFDLYPEAQTETPWKDTNMLALSTDEADTNLFDYSSSDNVDWTFSPTQADENFLPTFDDTILADSGAFCPLGRKRDGLSCSSTEAEESPLPNLQFPDVLGSFGIVNDNGGSTTLSDESSSNTNAATGSLTQPDPCIGYQFLHNLHVCCDGPPDLLPSGSNVVPWIKGCVLGKCAHDTLSSIESSTAVLLTDDRRPGGAHSFRRHSISCMLPENLGLLSRVIHAKFGKSSPPPYHAREKSI